MATEGVPQNLSSNDTDILDDPGSLGPTFMDETECRCTLQEKLGKEAWGCYQIWVFSDLFSVPTEATQTGQGIWFFATNQSDPVSLQELPNSNRNPPDITTSYIIQGGEFVKRTSLDDVFLDDSTCSGKNDTKSSADYYKMLATASVSSASECWQPGTVALKIQNVTQWNATGCSLGFLCKFVIPNAKR